jgi:translation initiation factor IF-1
VTRASGMRRIGQGSAGYTPLVQRGSRPHTRRRRNTHSDDDKTDLKDAVEVDGVIASSLSNGFYNVEIAGGHTVLARLAGKMSKGHIRVQVMDKVRVQMSVYDPTRGRIVWRFRE